MIPKLEFKERIGRIHISSTSTIASGRDVNFGCSYLKFTWTEAKKIITDTALYIIKDIKGIKVFSSNRQIHKVKIHKAIIRNSKIKFNYNNRRVVMRL